jgi:signal transduction histidine kinase
LAEYSNSGVIDEEVASDSLRSASSGDWERGVRLEALANLAHELRSPVQALLGYLDILRDELAEHLPRQDRQIIDRMNVNVHDLSQTVENLLEFALADAHAEATIGEDLLIDDLMIEVTPALEAANLGKELSLEVRIDEQLGKVHLRHRPLRSIVMNLALNAIKFTSKGSVLISFKQVSTPEFERALELTVTDTGPGIESSMLAQAFMRCAQLSNSSARKFRGMGLGLPVVKHNVDALGAKLTVKSAPDEGSSFIVTIPLRGVDGAARNPQLSMPSLLSASKNGRS